MHVGVGSTDRRVGGSGRRTCHRKRVDASSRGGGHQGHEVGEVKPWEEVTKTRTQPCTALKLIIEAIPMYRLAGYCWKRNV